MSLLARARRPDSPPLSRSTPVNGTFDYPELLVTYTPSLCKWVGPSVRYGLFFFTLKDDLTSDTAPAQRAVVCLPPGMLSEFAYHQHLYLVIFWFAMCNAMVNPIIYCTMNAK